MEQTLILHEIESLFGRQGIITHFKIQITCLSKANKSGSSFKFISIQTRIEQNLFIEKRSTNLVSFNNFNYIILKLKT